MSIPSDNVICRSHTLCLQEGVALPGTLLGLKPSGNDQKLGWPLGLVTEGARLPEDDL